MMKKCQLYNLLVQDFNILGHIFTSNTDNLSTEISYDMTDLVSLFVFVFMFDIINTNKVFFEGAPPVNG